MRVVVPLFILGLTTSSVCADPLIKANNLTYMGAIKTPGGNFGSSTLSYGGQVIAFNPSNNSLFITGNSQAQRVAEISLPAPALHANLYGGLPINTTNLPNLNTATVLQNFADITDGNMSKLAADGSAISGSVNIGGMMKWGSGLVGTVFSYYDGASAAKRSHFKSSTLLSDTTDFNGMFFVGVPAATPTTASFVSGFMSPIPDNTSVGGSNWQVLLGGKALTGNGTLSVLSRTSFGPAAFAFDPDRLGIDTPVVDVPLLYYTQSHPTLGIDGVEGNTNVLFNATTKIAGMVFVPGTRSVLYFGYHGIGPYSYGDWTADPNAVVPGAVYYDPTGMGNKGPHAYPYVYQVWAYDAAELLAVKDGTKQPYEVVPYATWKLPFNFAYTQTFGGGAAFDPSTNRLYISEPGALTSGCCDILPLIHVFQLDLSATPAASYKVGGTAMLLNGSVTLRNNGSDDLTVTAANRTTQQSFNFASQLAPGSTYNVTIVSQPAAQTCTVFNGTGTVNANADIANIVVSCDGAGGGAPPADTTPPTTDASPAEGTYTSTQSVTLSCTDPSGCEGVYFTVNGDTPIYPASGTTTQYAGPITVSSSRTVKWIARDTLGNKTATQTAAYIINPLAPPPGGAITLIRAEYK